MLFRRHTLAGAALLSVLTLPAVAQITPDDTLGNESSFLTEDVNVQGNLADLVEGGATRGGNLFHSFFEFNVDEGQRVYFANPVGIESILGRVTGENPSNIFGLLGVDGGADLFLLNPNGIVFGETASFDIEGAFYGTTGDAVDLGEDGIFSAVEPGSSRLLRVNPSVLLENYLTADSGDIESRGQLAVLGDLVLAGNGLDLQGQVAAGGNLTLLGLDGVRIRDTAETRFVGFAGGDLLVQGNQQVDIVALSHPESGLFSYGDMVLRSESPVGGDAHYWSGGGFRVETLEGDAGALESPVDPIIRTLGDVVIGEYEGSSLHILAGGSVEIGTAEINAPDPGELDIDFLRETITLSDGTVLEIDGGTQPTLDIRAGVAPDALGTPPLQLQTGFGFQDELNGAGLSTTTTPSSANIIIGDGYIDAPDGLILLTTQHIPNDDINGGNISVLADRGIYGDGLDARGFGGQGGAIYLDARQDIEAINSFISTKGAGDVGDVVLLASGSITFDSQDGSETGAFSFLEEGGTGEGGNIRIRATDLNLENGAQLVASLSGIGEGGDIDIEVSGNVVLTGSDRSLIENDVNASAEGNAGDINIKAATLLLQDGAVLSAETLGQGDSGDINITTNGDVRVEGIGDSRFNTLIINRVLGGATGNGGDINISSGGSFLMTNKAQISSVTEGLGDSGNVLIEARNNVSLSSASIFTEVSDGEISDSGGGIGDAGNITIRTRILSLLEGSQLRLDTENQGNAGDAFIFANESITIAGRGPGSGPNADIIVSSAISSTVEGEATGTGGDISITTEQLEVRDGGFVSADTYGQGDSGLILLNVQDSITLLGRSPTGFPSSLSNNVNEGATGNGKDIILNTDSLMLEDGAQIASTTEGNGNAGNVFITVRDDVFLSDAIIITEVTEMFGNGDGGNIVINANVLDLTNGSFLLADTENIGDAGSIFIEASERITLSGRNPDVLPSQITTTVEGDAIGEGGDISVATDTLKITDSAFISTSTFGQGLAGDVNLNVGSLTVENGAFIGASTLSTDPAGKIFITATNEVLISGRDENGPSQIISASLGDAGGNGNLTSIIVPVLILSDDALISAISEGAGFAGDIDIQVDSLEVLDSNIETNATQSLGGDISVNALSSEPSGIVILRGDSDITTDSLGDGGNITLNSVVVALDDSDILARSEDERGGNITFGPFFSDTLPIGAISPVEDNDRVDVSADGQLASGIITAPDTSFVENSLNELSGEFVDTATLTAGSCIVSADDDNTGSFVVTGGEGLPQQPGTAPLTVYPTDDIQSPTESTATLDIQEAHGVYQLADGRLVLSHECERAGDQ